MQKRGRLVVQREGDARHDHAIRLAYQTRRLQALPRRILEKMESWVPYLRRWKRSHEVVFPGYMLDFATLETAMEDFTNVKFIGHGPMFWARFNIHDDCAGDAGLGLQQIMRRHSNLYADISASSGLRALSRCLESSRNFLCEFSDRVIYGTDNIPHKHKRLIDSFGLPQQVASGLLGDNAERILDNS
jgi:predicted TIM-barrel fold metal-dependent hydrolase